MSKVEGGVSQASGISGKLLSWSAPVISAAELFTNLGGTLYGNASARRESWQSFLNTAWLQKQAQDWQERMSNTAHQREIADLRAAGLNPLLTLGEGGGAMAYSSPAGSTTPASQNGFKAQLFNMLTSAKQVNIAQQQANSQADLNAQLAQTEDTKRAKMEEEVQTLKTQQMVNKALAILHSKQATTEEKMLAHRILNLDMDTALKSSASANQRAGIEKMKGEIEVLKQEKKLKKAETKYTNERSRGYIDSGNMGANVNAFGTGIGANVGITKTH